MFANQGVLLSLWNRNEYAVKYCVNNYSGNGWPGAPLVLRESLVFNYAEGIQNQPLVVSSEITFHHFMESK